MRARQYDPRLGRFTQTDPIQENRPFQHYSYAENNPISRIDPQGLTDEEALNRFKRNIPVLLGGNEYGKRLYRMFETGGWKLDAEWFLFDNYRALHSKKVLKLDTGNESKAINKFIDWLEDQFGQAVSDEMFTEQTAGGQSQIESAAALRSQLWHETQLYAKGATASMLREGVAAATGPYGSAVNGLVHAAQGNHEAALLNAVPLAVHGIAGGVELTSQLAKVAKPSGSGDLITIFHGTDVASATSIVKKGINQEAARALGGGDVFWATSDLATARLFAKANPKGRSPAVVGITLRQSSLDRLVSSGAVQVEEGAIKVTNWDAFHQVVKYGRVE
jgi:hypothetical protein